MSERRIRIKIKAENEAIPCPGDVTVVDAETGEPIAGVFALAISAEVGKPSVVSLKMYSRDLDIDAEGFLNEEKKETANV